MSSANRTILITGANRGIGLCILTRLLQTFPKHSYLLGSRNLDAGATALEELRSQGIINSSHRVSILPLDAASNKSIEEAAEIIRSQHGGRLDVLVNNAGVASRLPPSLESSDLLDELARNWSETFTVNVFAPHIIFQAFLPFLLASSAPRVINISSGRASLSRSAGGNLPPTAVVSYSVSKVALNGLGVEMEKILAKASHDSGRVWAANPGHCKTAFNGYRGTRDPLEGAGVVVELLRNDELGEVIDSGFWEEEDGKLSSVPW